jgi:hypothetical protein
MTYPSMGEVTFTVDRIPTDRIIFPLGVVVSFVFILLAEGLLVIVKIKMNLSIDGPSSQIYATHSIVLE